MRLGLSGFVRLGFFLNDGVTSGGFIAFHLNHKYHKGPKYGTAKM